MCGFCSLSRCLSLRVFKLIIQVQGNFSVKKSYSEALHCNENVAQKSAWFKVTSQVY